MIYRSWHQFWFKEQSPLPLAIFRILLGCFVLQMSIVELLPNFIPFFGVKALVNYSTTCFYWWQDSPIFNVFTLLPAANSYRWLFFGIFVLFTVMLICGLLTRLSAFVVYLGLLSLHNQLPFVLNGSDDLIRILCFLLIFSPAGQMYSIDSLIRKRFSATNISEPMCSPWLQRVIQLQISLAYLAAFFCKIPGFQWQHGTAVYYACHLVEFQKFHLPFFCNYPIIYQFVTYYTLATELSMGILVWYRPWRYWVLLAGLIMHAGIDWTMNLPCFEWLFVSAYINFIEPADIKRAARLIYKILPAWITTIFKRIAGVVSSSISGQNSPKTKEHLFKHIWMHSNYAYWQFPLTVLVISMVLISGSLAAHQLQLDYADQEKTNSFSLGLYTTEMACLQSLTKPNEDEENKLKAKDSLAFVMSLTGRYQKAVQLLQSVLSYRSEHAHNYDLSLIQNLSLLADIYLETGHLDAAELCYQTIANYDLVNNPKSKIRAATDLNNLAVISYFRALTNKDETAKYLYLLKANNLYKNALDKLHLSRLALIAGSNTQKLRYNSTLLDILSNRFLTLREAGSFKEARTVQSRITKLQSKFI